MDTLKDLLRQQSSEFWHSLRRATVATQSFEEAIRLSTIRKRAQQTGLPKPADMRTEPLRLAMIGGCSLFPAHDLLEHFLACGTPSYQTKLLLGDYDNYTAEILEPDSRLYQFEPNVILLIPSYRRCRYPNHLHDAREQQAEQARQTASQLLDLCRTAHERSKAEILLSNFPLPARIDPGPYRVRTGGSDWSFRKQVNLELGLSAPDYVHICDVEFLSARRGTLASTDDRGWFESKQPGSPGLIFDLAREAALLVQSLRQVPKKVCVLDLDNTLWGGVIGDDGLDGIEIGDTNARGEAFKSFQQYLLSLTARGTLLAVCSKNDEDKALEPFEKHPEMVLRREHFASFKANWRPKSDNIREIAQDLNLGLDSFVFIDDNPAEIEIVRQFVPEVTGILLGPDPSEYAGQVQDARLFEPHNITAQDAERAEQYKQEAQRQGLQSNFTDMASYWESLSMKGAIVEFQSVDVPRIAQLIGRSNQFNVTTRRRTESEVRDVMLDPDYRSFNIRLEDRFGDYGLIAVVIGEVVAETMEIDTWLMSCRVLKRQVEEETVNEMVRLALQSGCTRIRGVYLPTKKNGMVKDLYPQTGFRVVSEDSERREFELELSGYTHKETKIVITNRAYDQA